MTSVRIGRTKILLKRSYYSTLNTLHSLCCYFNSPTMDIYLMKLFQRDIWWLHDWTVWNKFARSLLSDFWLFPLLLAYCV